MRPSRARRGSGRLACEARSRSRVLAQPWSRRAGCRQAFRALGAVRVSCRQYRPATKKNNYWRGRRGKMTLGGGPRYWPQGDFPHPTVTPRRYQGWRSIGRRLGRRRPIGWVARGVIFGNGRFPVPMIYSAQTIGLTLGCTILDSRGRSPHVRSSNSCPLLDRGAGGRSPGYPASSRRVSQRPLISMPCRASA